MGRACGSLPPTGSGSQWGSGGLGWNCPECVCVGGLSLGRGVPVTGGAPATVRGGERLVRGARGWPPCGHRLRLPPAGQRPGWLDWGGRGEENGGTGAGRAAQTRTPGPQRGAPQDPQFAQQALTHALLMDAVVGALQTPGAIYAASKLSYFDKMRSESKARGFGRGGGGLGGGRGVKPQPQAWPPLFIAVRAGGGGETSVRREPLGGCLLHIPLHLPTPGTEPTTGPVPRPGIGP